MRDRTVSRRRLAAAIVAALAIAACLASGWSSASSADQSKATLSVATHHHVASSTHLDGAVIASAVGALALWFARERAFRSVAMRPAVISTIQRRGPPNLRA